MHAESSDFGVTYAVAEYSFTCAFMLEGLDYIDQCVWSLTIMKCNADRTILDYATDKYWSQLWRRCDCEEVCVSLLSSF